MKGSPRDTWKELLNRFDPERVTRSDWRADRHDSPAHKIISSLDRPTASPAKVLLSGTIGSGKSTELFRVAEARAQEGKEFVIVLDLVRHFRKVVGDLDALQNVGSWEVCFLVGVALVRAAKERYGYDFPSEQLSQLEQAWRELAQAAQPDHASPPTIDLLKVVKSLTLTASTVAEPAAMAVGAPPGAGIAVGGLRCLAEIVGSGNWTLPFGRKGTKALEDQDELMKTLVDKVNVLLSTYQQFNRPVLVVIDGLDRIVDGNRAKALFLHSEMIARLDCQLVVCAPFALRSDMAATEARGFRLRTLHNAPVLNEVDPTQPGPGVGFLRDVFRRRVQDLGAEGIVPEEQLNRIAYYSGGRLRDFIKTIHMLAERGWDDDAPQATEDHVDDALTEMRQLVETGLDRGHLAVLQAVTKDPDRRLPDDDRARELLTYGRLLPYPNGSEWYYPHPLLTLQMLRAK